MKSPEDYSPLFDKMSQGVVFQDAEGKIISANQAALEILGLTEDQLMGRTSLDPRWRSIHEDGSDFPGNTHPAIVALKECRKVSNTIMGVFNPANNAYRWIKITAEPLFRNGEKHPYQVFVTFDDITDLKKYSGELERINDQLEREVSARREVQAQMLSILQNVPVGIFQTNEKGRIIYGNPVAQSIWQGVRYVGLDDYTEYRAWNKDTGKELKPQDWGAFKALNYGESSLNEKLLIECFDGKFKTILNSAVPVYDDQKRIIGALIVNQDITDMDRKDEQLLDQAQQLKRNEQLLRLFVEHAPAAIAMLDNEMNYIVASKRYLSDYNLGEQNLEGRNHYDIFPEVPERWKEIHRRCLEGAIESNEADPFLRLDGHTDWVRWEIRPWYEDSDKVGGIIIFSEVITDRILALEALKNEKEHAQRLEENFRQLADAMPQVVWTADKHGKITYLNKRWIEYSGLSYDRGMDWEWVNTVHPDDKNRMIDLWTETVKIKTLYEATCRVRNSIGQYRWQLIRAIPQLDENGEADKWIGTNTDIHEQKLMEQALESSNKELEQFAYVASHDLQEPLRMITSYTKLLSDRYKGRLDEKADQYIAFADEGAKRMHTLIKDLLMLSRLTTRAKPLEHVSCSTILENVLSDLRLLISENNADIKYGDLPTIIADPTQIRQLFQNLIENAIKFHHQERTPEIEISAERKDGRWLFSIKDNGIGIESRFFERIFITFQRLHERDKYTGSGIGLAACKKIVERHGGQIWLESDPGKGSTFYFTIP